MVGKLSPGQNGKVFGQAFFKKLAGDKRGRRPLLCSAARRKTRSKCRNAKQIKFRAGQKQRSDFLAAPFHKAPPGRQKSEREFCLFGGVFLRPMCRAMWRADRFCAACRSCGGFCAWPALFIRSVLCLRGFFLLSFTFSCLTFASQNSFHLSLRPRRASTFFRKESRQRFARGRGSAPFEPPFLCPAADLPFSRAAGRLNGPSAANRRLTGKRLKSPGAELSFSSVSVRRGTPAP